MKADVLTKGTQLKMLWYLQGNQRVIFKPKRYDREHVIQGKGKVLNSCIHQVSMSDQFETVYKANAEPFATDYKTEKSL